jgi:hypothetical protein
LGAIGELRALGELRAFAVIENIWFGVQKHEKIAGSQDDGFVEEGLRVYQVE